MNVAKLPLKLMLRRAGLAAMIGGTIWPICATWLSANRFITVIAELASFWLSFMAVLLGGWCVSRANQGEFRTRAYTAAGILAGPLALLIVIWTWLVSDLAFFHWKLRAIRPEVWNQMALDFEGLATAAPAGDTLRLSATKAPPKSIQQLGLGDDYDGINAAMVSYPDYKGPAGDILFGNKSRAWGLWLGPEKSLDSFCRGCRRARVGPNAIFFVGPRG